MPSIDGGAAEFVYFGVGRPPSPNTLRPLPDAFALAYSTALRGASRKEYHTVISEMIGRVLHAPSERLSADERVVREALGPYSALMSDVAYTLEIGKNREDVIERSIINQNLAVDFYRIQSGQADEQTVRAAQFGVSAFYALSQRYIPFGREAMNIINGARSQAAGMHTLKEAGYHIVVPDTKMKQDVEVWDIVGGVDFVAVGKHPKTQRPYLHMIDTTGRKFVRENASMTENSGILVEKLPTPLPQTPRKIAQDQIIDDTLLLLRKEGMIDGSWLQDIGIMRQHIRLPTAEAHMHLDGSLRSSVLTRQLVSGVQNV